MKRRSLFIPKPIWLALDEIAREKDVTISELIRNILARFIEQDVKEKKDG